MTSPSFGNKEDIIMSRKPKDQDPSSEAATGTIDIPQGDAAETGPGFAQKVGKKEYPKVAPDPFGIAKDNLAGVRLFESREDRQVAIKFGDGSPESKPSQAVIDLVKEAGFRWDPRERIWAQPVRGNSAMSTRIDAERLYQEVSRMIREEKGIEPGQGVPF